MPQEPQDRNAWKCVIVGGGVAGVCCAEEYCRLCPETSVSLVSAESDIKGVEKVTRITEHLEELTLKLQSLYSLPKSLDSSNLRTVRGTASRLDTNAKVLHLSDGQQLPYDQLCICTGASAKVAAVDERVIALRDHDSVQVLLVRLSTARRIMVLGNGGIALELVHALQAVDTVWAVRNSHIGDAFFDVDAAAFLLEELQADGSPASPDTPSHPEDAYCSTHPDPLRDDATEGAQHGGIAIPGLRPMAPVAGSYGSSLCSGATSFSQRQGIREAGGISGMAVGPEWTRLLQQSRGTSGGKLTLEYSCELDSLVSQPDNADDDGEESWPLYVRLTNGAIHGVDFAVSATGVEPRTEWLPLTVKCHPTDKGVEVDDQLRTSASGVFAAGDACCAAALEQASAQWFQMRLWTQARTMGKHAAQCMFNATAPPENTLLTGLHFELFTHVTRFCGKKVILLGLYNGQRLNEEPAADIITYARSVEGLDSVFVRVLLLRGRMQGAVLIGNTDMEEMYENLILNGLDVSQYGPDLVDPDAELHEAFD